MFSTAQDAYVRNVVEVMRIKGYEHYVARTVTETGNNYDLDIVFSKTSITGSSMTSYIISSGIRYQVDTSAYSASAGSHARVVTGTYNGTYTVPVYEFVYSNASFSSSTAVQPDVRFLSGVQSENTLNISMLVMFGFFAVVTVLILNFTSNLLKGK